MLKLKNILNMYALLILVQLFSIAERVNASDKSKNYFVAENYPENNLPHPSYKEKVENIVDNDDLSLAEFHINDQDITGKVVIYKLPENEVVGYGSTNDNEIVTLAADLRFDDRDVAQMIQSILWLRETEEKTINRMEFAAVNERLGEGLKRAGFTYQGKPDIDNMQLAILKQALKLQPKKKGK